MARTGEPEASDVARDDAPLRWRLAGMPGQLTEASYLVTANAAQFRLIVDIIEQEQSHRLTGVSREELPDLLRTQLARLLTPHHAAELQTELLAALDNRLAQLVAWRTLEAWQDDARTDEDFLRNRERYQLTERGAAVHRLAREVEADATAASTTAVLAPPILATQAALALDALRAGDIAAGANALTLLQTTLADMARTASVWQSRLAATIGGVPDEHKVARLRQTVSDYIEMWGAGVDVHSDAISASARALLQHDDGTWRAVALQRLPADAPEASVEPVTVEVKAAVTTLDRWFSGPTAQARRLRLQIRDAVAPLVRSHRTLLAVGGAVSRQAELLDLAARLDAAATDEAAWTIWCTATGLFGARHLGIPAPDVANPAGTSFWDAPPAPIERRLRTSGPRALSGRSPLVVDTSRQRRAARAAAAYDQARTAAAEAALAARSGTVLSSWEPLDEDQADVLLDLLAAARVTSTPDWTVREAVSRDGRWTARFRRVEPRGSAVIRMPSGRLVVEDALVEVAR
ncbi:MAG: DUF2397 domain-containing protein [Dermatophilaceae bacterium]